MNAEDTNLTQSHRVLALAGIVQAAKLIRHISTLGQCDESALKTCVDSILKIDAPTVEAIYGDPHHLNMGLQELLYLLGNYKKPKDAELARYVFALMHLERKLSKNPIMVNQLKTGIERAASQAEYFSSLHDNVMANLASLYTDTLSTFSFRIYITGLPLYLNQSRHMNKIRTLLLAGIRSAVLWNQLGGRRWQLVISRSSIVETAQGLLEQQALSLQE